MGQRPPRLDPDAIEPPCQVLLRTTSAPNDVAVCFRSTRSFCDCLSPVDGGHRQISLRIRTSATTNPTMICNTHVRAIVCTALATSRPPVAKQYLRGAVTSSQAHGAYDALAGSSSPADHLVKMMLWMTPSEAPEASQASECSEVLDPMRASCWISAQH